MSSKESSASPPSLNPADFVRFGQKQTATFMEMQREILSLVEQANRDLIARTELERELAAELTTKLSSAKTPPEIAKVYQEWMTRRLSILTEDGRKFLTDSQSLVASATRLFSNGGQGGGT